MSIFPGRGIAELIVVALRKGPLTVDALAEYVAKKYQKVTIQGMYKALRKLRAERIVILHKKKAVLDRTWIQKLERFVLVTEHAYKTPSGDSGHFLQMADGDRITYSFKDPLQVDIFNNHILYILFDALPNVDRWFAYAPHHWFMLARREEEIALMRHMNSKGIKYLFTSGYDGRLDRYIKKEFDGINAKYHMRERPLFKDKSYHQGIVINVFGDYIIEVRHDRETARKIDSFYKKSQAGLSHGNKEGMLDPKKIDELKNIVSKQSHNKLSISRNAEKAERLRKIFGKNFL